ncbi:unnamed protein product [Hydatigera taeniaeformis]|uniref:Cytidine deaminase n=1 Tax=Hydatigena taeniaeformis TaxID=6205 RepID=A0A0R3X715_HYDTA|nr:unnamed protein product [Hydatigera taeniaeformis]
MASTLTPEMEKVRKASMSVLKNAYCGYSKFSVGAALLDLEGRLFTGVNVENASFPCGWCAEVSAFGAAITAGVKDFAALAVAVAGDKFTPPCGRCRQVISEFCYGKNMPIVLVNGKGEYHLTKIEELLPLAFLSKNMDSK